MDSPSHNELVSSGHVYKVGILLMIFWGILQQDLSIQVKLIPFNDIALTFGHA